MSNLAPGEARRRFMAGRVARLATVTSAGQPHLVPVTFAVVGEGQIVTAVDHKPKRTSALARLANIAANPRVSMLVDHYDEDWAQLWWARADGHATVHPPAAQTSATAAALRELAARYEQYTDRTPAGPVVVLDVVRWSGWSASPPGG